MLCKKKKGPIKYYNKNQDNVAIYKNILVNNGTATAFFVINPFNYTTVNGESREAHISMLYNTISLLYNSMGELKFSLFNVSNIISNKEVVHQILETINRYNKEVDSIPEKYQRLMSTVHENFTILAIDMDIHKAVNIEKQSAFDIAKQSLTDIIKTNFSLNANDISEDILMRKDSMYMQALYSRAIPADEKLVLNIYMNLLFPEYDIIYNNEIMNHSSDIIANVQQEMIPRVGSMILTNTGVASVLAEPKETYASILRVLSFPTDIDTKIFNMNVPGLKINVWCKPKEKVELEFKRMRASVKEEYGEAATLGDEDNTSINDWADMNDAIQANRQNRILADVDANILISATNEEDMLKKRANMVSTLMYSDVITGIAPNQADTFIKSFVKGQPADYFHVMDLEYALSFNQDYGVSIGDSDSKFHAMKIGEAE